MQFRVTSIQDEGLPEHFNDAQLWLEGWFNKSLQDFDFGCNEVRIMIVVFCTSSSLLGEPAASRLSSTKDSSPLLALHIVVDPESVVKALAEDQLCLLCANIAKGLPAKLIRNPKGLDYTRLREALVACIQPFAGAT
jgi:hypothetical protein